MDNKNVTVMYFDDNTPAETLNRLTKALRETLDTTLIAIPKNFDLMLNCSIDQLYQVKTLIDTAISLKLEQEQDTPISKILS